MRLLPRAVLVVAVLTIACGDPVGPPRDFLGSPADFVLAYTNATVRWQNLEGGFWTLETSDGRWLDPQSSLPAAFQVDGLAVRVKARALTGVGGYHMFGEIVEIIAIQNR